MPTKAPKKPVKTKPASSPKKPAKPYYDDDGYCDDTMPPKKKK